MPYSSQSQVHEVSDVHHAVGHDLHRLIVDGDVRFRYTGTLDLTSLFTGQGLACLCQDLTGHGIDHRLSQCLTSQAQADCQLLIILIAAYPGHIVPSGVEEQVVQMGLGTLHRRRLTGTQLAVYFQQAVLYALGSILLNGGTQGGIIAEQTQDLLIGTDTQRTDKGGDGQLAVLVDAGHRTHHWSRFRIPAMHRGWG